MDSDTIPIDINYDLIDTDVDRDGMVLIEVDLPYPEAFRITPSDAVRLGHLLIGTAMTASARPQAPRGGGSIPEG